MYEFPSMLKVSLYSADAVIIVFNLDDPETFEEAARLRDLVLQAKGAGSSSKVCLALKKHFLYA